MLQNLCKEHIRVNHGENEQNISTLCSALFVVDVIYSMFLSHYYKYISLLLLLFCDN